MPRSDRFPFLRTPLSITAAGALVVGCVLAAGPAQAAVVNDTIPNEFSEILAPANEVAQVTFVDNRSEEPTGTFPAGTYWISTSTYNAEGSEPEAWQAITLASPGALRVSLPSVGPAGTENFLSVVEVPAGAGDPATKTPEEILDIVGDVDLADLVSVSAARVDITRPAPSFGADIPAEAGENPVWADFYDIGVDTPAYRLGNVWHVASLDSPGKVTRITFGRASDEAFVGDWDGDGRDTFAVHRGNTWRFDNDLSGGNADVTTVFGRAGDLGLVGDWDGDGTDSIGIRRGNVFHLRNDVTEGPATYVFAYGRVSDSPYADDWDLDGKDTIAVMRGDDLLIRNSLTGGPADEVITGVVAPGK